MQKLVELKLRELVDSLGITQTHWRYLPDRSVKSFLQTTNLSPKNICYGIEILGSEYVDKSDLNVLKRMRTEQAIDEIIEFYKKGDYSVQVKSNVYGKEVGK